MLAVEGCGLRRGLIKTAAPSSNGCPQTTTHDAHFGAARSSCRVVTRPVYTRALSMALWGWTRVSRRLTLAENGNCKSRANGAGTRGY